MTQAFRVAQEDERGKSRRIEGNKLHKADRQAKLERTRYGGAKDDVYLTNMFRQFGIDYLSTPKDQVYELLRAKIEGKKLSITDAALDFLKEHYGDQIQAEIDFNAKVLIKFQEVKIKKGEEMNLFTEVAEKSGQSRKIVKSVYEALCSRIRVNLKNERRIRLPELGILKISFRAAKEKRKGRNPFNGKIMTFKAKPASNKLRFTPVKDMKEYVKEKIEVVAPKKKHKKGKKGKK